MCIVEQINVESFWLVVYKEPKEDTQRAGVTEEYPRYRQTWRKMSHTGDP